MKIAIDVSPLQSGHKIRGVGFYLERLKKSLLENFSEHTYIFFTQKEPLTQSVDIVHYPYFDPFFPTLPLRNKYKTVVTVHDLTPLVFPNHFPAGVKGNIQWQLQKFKLKQADAIIADSIASKSDIIKIAGIHTDKVSVVYLAADKVFKNYKISDAKKQALIKKYSLPEKFVLYVGDITWNKNIPRLVQAIQQTDIPLVMVGKALAQKDFDITNPWNKDLITFNKQIENSESIKVLGFVPTKDLVDLYNIASLFVFPSVYEGFGLPVIEAMQSGLPVVTSREGSLSEVAGDAAEYVDSYNPANIAEGISKVYQSKNIQEDLSKKGIEQSKNFNWKKTARETIQVYKNVLERS